MVLINILNKGIAELLSCGVNDPKRDASVLLAHTLQCDQTFMVLNPQHPLTQTQEETYLSFIHRRCHHEPVAKIIGEKEFWSLPFKTSIHTLDPRPDSETLIEALLAHYQGTKPPQTILDMGTGTGCLLLTLLSEWRDASGTGIDISEKALEVAQENACALGLDNRSSFLLSDWFKGVSGSFDLIISNPPYIPQQDLETLAPDLAFDPQGALSLTHETDPHTKDGLSAYRLIASDAHNHLTEKGRIIVEYGQNQHQDVKDIFASAGLQRLSDHKDLGGIIRCSLFKASV